MKGGVEAPHRHPPPPSPPCPPPSTSMSPCRPSSKESTTSLSFPKWDDTRVSPFLLRAPQTVTIIIAPSPPPLCSLQLSLYFLIEIGERARSIHSLFSSANRDVDEEASICSNPKEGRRDGGKAASSCEMHLPTKSRASVMQPSFLPSLLSVPPAATKRLGSPSLFCRSALSLGAAAAAASSKAFAAAI